MNLNWLILARSRGSNKKEVIEKKRGAGWMDEWMEEESTHFRDWRCSSQKGGAGGEFAAEANFPTFPNGRTMAKVQRQLFDAIQLL